MVLLFVAGFAARYVHPRHLWWLQLVAIGLPYLSVAVLSVTPLVALGGPCRLLVLHLALCLLVATRFLATARLGGWFAASDAQTPTLKVMTFNLWPKHPQVENWRATNALFQTEQPDLATLQEMPRWLSAVEFMYAPTSVSADSVAEGQDGEEAMRAQDGSAPRYYETTLDVPESCRSGQVVLSTIPLIE